MLIKVTQCFSFTNKNQIFIVISTVRLSSEDRVANKMHTAFFNLLFLVDLCDNFKILQNFKTDSYVLLLSCTR